MKNLFLIVVLIVQCNFVFAQETINLAGEWQVKLDPKNQGIEKEWFNKTSLPDVLNLPGCIQEQGYGAGIIPTNSCCNCEYLPYLKQLENATYSL